MKELLSSHYLPARRSEGLRATTIDQYSNVIDAWILPHLRAVQVQKLTPKIVGDWITKLQSEGSRADKPLSPRSMQLSVTILKSATRWALENRLIDRDPLAGVRRPRGGASRATNAWTPASAMAFLASVKSDRLAAAWWLFLARGLRRGELAGLKWSAIDLDAGSLRVIETRVVVNGHAQTSSPKTDSGRRSIPLDEHLVALLKAHRIVQRQERDVISIADPGYVFTNEVGLPYNPDWISRRFVELANAAKLPALTVHGTRHTAASIMLSSGEDPATVAGILGHSSPVITMGIYRHLFEGETAGAGERMSRMLSGNAEAIR